MPAATTLTTLQHVLRNVMKVDETKSHLEEALSSDDFVDLAGFLSLKEDDMKELKWVSTDANGNPMDHHMTKGIIGKIEAFQSFVIHPTETGRAPETDVDWRALTAEAFDQCRTSGAFISIRIGRTPKGQKDPVSEFKRGIKQDPTLFPTLKDDKQWDNW